jgi:hypothetical protein
MVRGTGFDRRLLQPSRTHSTPASWSCTWINDMQRKRFVVYLLLAAVAALSLCACGRHANNTDDATAATQGGADVALPKPQAGGGSVTGMPSTPGPNPVGAALAASAEDAPPTGQSVANPATAAIVAGDVAAAQAVGADDKTAVVAIDAEPSVQDAVAVLQAYYAAINQHDFQRAWSSWADGGRASGQTAQQFADGFANTAQVTLQPGAPGRMEGAAGSRYVEVPVAIQATQRDGTLHRYTGTYTLRRAVVDGATDAQRAWHIASAALHETGP